MAKSYLIDTSAVIKYLNGSMTESGLDFLDSVIDDCRISFITQIELQVWDPPNKEDILVYNEFVSRAQITGISDAIIAETITIRKTKNLKLPDALIAATAIVSDLTLIADNDKDFLKTPNLKVVNPNKTN